MLYLYLDESGDLGFDFVNKKPSGFFTICVLAVKGAENDRALTKAVQAVIRRKVFPRYKSGNLELKGSLIPFETKKYFFGMVCPIDFKLHFVTLDKRKACAGLYADKERVYNYIARLTLEKVNFTDAAIRVIMTVDKLKPRQGVRAFNAYMLQHLKANIDPLVPLDIFHVPSQESPGLQAADMFSWGVFRKHERGDQEWYGVYSGKISSEAVYRPGNEEERAGQAHRPGS